jgi:transcriptional regulator with XRE-family HTH domain
VNASLHLATAARQLDVDIAQFLVAARHRLGLSQREYARLVGCDHGAIAAYERARKRPTLATLVRLLDATGVDVHLTIATKPVGDQPSLWDDDVVS